MHWWVESIVTATPFASSDSIIVFATCIVSLSWVCNLFEKTSTTLASLLKPTTLSFGMYATWAFPIIGKAHVAYIPKERVVGLSKLARVVEVFSKRLQTQERLTMQIANTLMKSLDAKGVAVTIDSTHQCMTMRGIKKEQATTVTNYYLGQFKEDLSYQNRYLRLISNSKD